ncbi:MAG: type II toxin-antitoxin system HicB family antitoxin [Cyanobacteriota bacterium]|nr:type II toxin-antitoxin system HicB family antitoxin [Cyanobacteriota bacterium]
MPHFSWVRPLEYWKDEGWFVGRLRGIPGVFSQGKTLDELEDNIRDAYTLMIEDEEATLRAFSS